jgi:hypothetical protein
MEPCHERIVEPWPPIQPSDSTKRSKAFRELAPDLEGFIRWAHLTGEIRVIAAARRFNAYMESRVDNRDKNENESPAH